MSATYGSASHMKNTALQIISPVFFSYLIDKNIKKAVDYFKQTLKCYFYTHSYLAAYR